MGLFGDTKIINAQPSGLSDDVLKMADEQAAVTTAQTPEEQQLLAYLRQRFPGADQAVLDEMSKLSARGEDLANVDQAYMNRAYQPGYERLMQDYDLMDRNLMENLNARGISAIPGGMSEQEAYQRMLLARDTKENLGRNMLEAQNQAVQQKLAQYNARLAETDQANTRRGQIFDPYFSGTVVPESERQKNRIDAAGNIYNAKLGYQAKMHEINTNRKMAGDQRMMDLAGSGAGVAAAGIGALAMFSDVNMKKDFEPAGSDEQALADVDSLPVSRWRYQMEPEGSPMHTGAMAQDMPPDISPDGRTVDIPSYLGKTTQAVQALSKRMDAFEQLLMTGGR